MKKKNLWNSTLYKYLYNSTIHGDQLFPSVPLSSSSASSILLSCQLLRASSTQLYCVRVRVCIRRPKPLHSVAATTPTTYNNPFVRRCFGRIEEGAVGQMRSLDDRGWGGGIRECQTKSHAKYRGEGARRLAAGLPPPPPPPPGR